MRPPNEERHFVHRRIIGGITGLIGGGAPGAIAGFLTGGGGGSGVSAGTLERERTNAQLLAAGLPLKGGESLGTYLAGIPENLQILAMNILGIGGGDNGVPGGECEPPLVFNGRFCEFPGSPAGGMGELRKGRYGPAEEPFFETRNVRSCLAGFILGDDKLCYKKGTITNKQRLWPKGTAPLLTGGEMSAIRKAARAAAKFERVGKRLRGMGLVAPPRQKRKKTPAGHVATLTHT